MVHKQRYVPNSRVSRHGYALDGTPQHNDHQNNNASSFTMKFYLKDRYVIYFITYKDQQNFHSV